MIFLKILNIPIRLKSLKVCNSPIKVAGSHTDKGFYQIFSLSKINKYVYAYIIFEHILIFKVVVSIYRVFPNIS